MFVTAEETKYIAVQIEMSIHYLKNFDIIQKLEKRLKQIEEEHGLANRQVASVRQFSYESDSNPVTI